MNDPSDPKPVSNKSFEDFDLIPEIQTRLKDLNFVIPTPIQSLSLPFVLAGRDVVAQAETGSGKTLAFGLPMIQKVDTERVSVQGLVLCPTRELAEQVKDVLIEIGSPLGVRVGLAVGGVFARNQLQEILGAQILVGTPGRVLDYLRSGDLGLGWVELSVLDEFDRMLDMGFIDDVKAILSFLPPERQTLLFCCPYLVKKP